MEDFIRILHTLAKAKIEFVVIGGFAATLHGSTYVTRDVDICARLDDETVKLLRSALAELRPLHRMTDPRLSFLVHPSFTAGLKNLYLQTDSGVLDVLTEVAGIGMFEEVARHAETGEIQGVPIRIISLADLINCKETVGRDKDLLVAKELRAIAALRGIPVPPPPAQPGKSADT
ncbi:MAG: nucleotidyltransferase [Opitutaceae bacterium]|nr:nucleotidyltransferase [Opitutaceae bacterium]